MKYIAIPLGLLMPFLVFAQDNGQNWAKTKTYKAGSSTSESFGPDKIITSVTYFDGLGRPIQEIAGKQSANGQDIIRHIQYDDFGRQPVQYLPYVKDDNNLNFDTNAASNTVDYEEYTGSKPYSETLFEDSPFSRPLKQSAPGTDQNWAMGSNHEVAFSYATNAVADSIKKLLPALQGNQLIHSGFYQQHMLYKNTVTDENGHPAESFTDVEGKLILKRQFNSTAKYDTYYVYDDRKNLVAVVPPKALDVTSSTVFSQLCYAYFYDSYDRLIEKRLPGKAPEYIVYDKLNRIVATGPVFSPYATGGQGWLMSFYDENSRVAFTGWLQDQDFEASAEPPATPITVRETMQAQYDGAVKNAIKTTLQNSASSCPLFYEYNDLPRDLVLLTVNYYDDYDFPGAPANFSAAYFEEVPYYNNTIRPMGMPTGSWARILDNPGTAHGETSYILYDKWGRPIISEVKNDYHDSSLYLESKLDFTGQADKTTTRHTRGQSDPLVIEESFTYSDQELLLSHTHKIGSHTEVLAQNSYSKLGRLVRKDTGVHSSLGALQQVDYTYNIRGWLTGINNYNQLHDHDDKDVFAFGIKYENPSGGGGEQYNGNISQTYWRSETDNIVRNYTYNYDDIGRITAATYSKDGQTTGSYNEQLSYDANGNIQKLERYGNLDNMVFPNKIDSLDYQYEPYSNKLLKVIDATASPLGFKDNPEDTLEHSPAPDYDYDSAGNLIHDANKRIASISYNHLNLPVDIVFYTNHKMNYIYTATGKKILKDAPAGGDQPAQARTVTDYLWGFQYQNNMLKFFPTAEGYVSHVVADSTDAYRYVYNYLDHLGNVRLSYGRDESDKIRILEENHYYPYGLKHTNYNPDLKKYDKKEDTEEVVLKAIPVTDESKYDYKFNGMEFQDELGLNLYDMDMRDYDPAIGRWTGIDPVTHFDQSTYMAFNGNPVYFADPSGADGHGAGGTYTNAYGVANYQGYNGYNSPMSNFGAFEGGFMSVADEMGSGIFSTSSPGEIAAIGNSLGLWNVSNIWVPGREGGSGVGGVNVYSGHWENVGEPPVNLFNSGKDVFNSVANSRRYVVGDRKFSVYAHGAPGFIMDEKYAVGIRNSVGFDIVMNRNNPDWANAKSQVGTVLSLWSCQSATIENGNPSIAQIISKANPNITVIGADGFVNYGVSSNNAYLISGVDTVKDSGRNDGFIVAYKNGIEVYRESFAKF